MSHTPPPIQDEIPEKSLIQSQPHLNRQEDSNKKENLVKWLYPFDLEEGVENMADDAASAVAAAAETASNESGKKPPMTHQDSLEDKGSVDSCDTKETSDDDEIDVSEITEEITKQVTAGATALGSMFNTAWSKTQKAATTGVTSGVKASTSLFNFAAGYDLNKPSDDEDDDFAEGASSVKGTEEKKAEAASVMPKSQSAWGFGGIGAGMGGLNLGGMSSAASAWSKSVSDTVTKSTSWTADLASAAVGAGTSKPSEAADDTKEQDGESNPAGAAGGSLFGGIGADLSSLVKVASDATEAIKAKAKDASAAINSTILLNDFNREQEAFIKNKVCDELTGGVAPWIGYADEDIVEAMKAKILSLSVDKRTFVRAPPSGVTFDFDYSTVSAVAMALLKEDQQLQKMRYELVPKVVKEDEFWRNYFYRVNLIKQSFDLQDLEAREEEANLKRGQQAEAAESRLQPPADEDLNKENASGDANEEFVSESYRVSSKDMAEVDESMKRLGVGGTGGKGKSGTSGGGDVDDNDWENELEGELNEFEVVSSTGGADSNESCPEEWENQIQEMLDAESEDPKSPEK